MIGALIGAGASLLGGMFGRKDAKKQQQASIKAAAAQEERNYERQKEFAKSGIQWKVADAKKAGIHPLYSLGASTTSFSGYAGTGDYSNPAATDYSSLAAAGQDIGRAIDSTRSPGEKLTAYAKTVQDLTLQRMGLENEVLASQVAKIRSSTTPGIPSETDQYLIEGQNVPGTVVETPLKRVAPGPGGFREPGAVSDIGYSKNAFGGYSVIASDDVKRRIEDSPEEWVHYYRNNIHPWFNKDSRRPPPIPLKSRHAWAYDPVFGYYQYPYESAEHRNFRNRFGY